jgi:hypothetical protein
MQPIDFIRQWYHAFRREFFDLRLPILLPVEEVGVTQGAEWAAGPDDGFYP